APSGLTIPASLRPILSGVIAIAFEALLFVPVWLMAVIRAHGSWASVGFRRFNTALGCTLPILFVIAAYAISLVWGVVIRIMNWPMQESLAPRFGNDPLAIALGYIGAAIVAPLAEETFFRGFVLGGLRKRFGLIGALLISATFFALLHPPIYIFPIIFGWGILLGLLFVQTGSLVPGILMHATLNSLAFAVQVYCNLNHCLPQ
ncbi:MAG: CPBP family intramembrane metalloprotease, partial [Chloroflexi bacterium]|nr:CPBP family intramembrane metalloprotease [Chloroflexota bacterium]